MVPLRTVSLSYPYLSSHLSEGDVVDSDQTITATNIDSLSVGRPVDAHASWGLLGIIFVGDGDLGEQVLVLICNVPDLDSSISSSSKPLEGGVELNGIDD